MNLNAGNLVLVGGVQFGVGRVRDTHFVPGLKQFFGTECRSGFSFFILNKNNFSIFNILYYVMGNVEIGKDNKDKG